MFDKEYLKKLRAEKKQWEETILRDRLAQAKETRESFKTNSQIEVNRVYTPLDLEEGGFAIALDLPTHKALDSDDPLAEGEVGKTGVPIDSLKSLEKLFEGIPLNSVSMFICVAMSTGPIILALFLALA